MTLYSEFQEKIATHTQTHRLTHTHRGFLMQSICAFLQQAEITESHQNVSVFSTFLSIFFFFVINSFVIKIGIFSDRKGFPSMSACALRHHILFYSGVGGINYQQHCDAAPSAHSRVCF